MTILLGICLNSDDPVERLLESIMSQPENPPLRLRGLSLRTVLLLMLVIAAGAGATAYSVASTLSAGSIGNGIGHMAQNTSNSPTPLLCNQTQPPPAFIAG